METRRDRKRDLADHSAKLKHDRRKITGGSKSRGRERWGFEENEREREGVFKGLIY